jgi:drug/metabolite transporter (DMT)-like permease
MDAATGSLLLILEAPLTLVLAHVAFRERLGRRVVAAASLIFAGALLLALRPAIAPGTALGSVLVVGAALCWALDNLLSRPLAEIDPARSVVWKGLLGGGLSAASAVVLGEGRPSLSRAAALLLLGGVGYGVSLRLYLRAQTLVGAARTASVFAAAPFVGAALAVALGSAWPGWQLPVGGGLMLAGVALHLLERHHHRHVHDAVAHEHLHTHDDGHHSHEHDPTLSGPHSHPHRHEALTHDHGHSEDLHHRHKH